VTALTILLALAAGGLAIDLILLSTDTSRAGPQGSLAAIQPGLRPLDGFPRSSDALHRYHELISSPGPKPTATVIKPFAQGVKPSLPLICSRLTIVCNPIPLVRDTVPLIRRTVALVRDKVPLVRRGVPLIHGVRRLAHCAMTSARVFEIRTRPRIREARRIRLTHKGTLRR
jgi:hypothetical protein